MKPTRVAASVVVLLPIQEILIGQRRVEVHVLNLEGTVMYRRSLALDEYPDLEMIGGIVKHTVLAELRRLLSAT